jgi:hypothetical protein
VHEYLVHGDVSTLMLYTHLLYRGGFGVRIPADQLSCSGLAVFPD